MCRVVPGKPPNTTPCSQHSSVAHPHTSSNPTISPISQQRGLRDVSIYPSLLSTFGPILMSFGTLRQYHDIYRTHRNMASKLKTSTMQCNLCMHPLSGQCDSCLTRYTGGASQRAKWGSWSHAVRCYGGCQHECLGVLRLWCWPRSTTLNLCEDWSPSRSQAQPGLLHD
jgi:hypothetical protein